MSSKELIDCGTNAWKSYLTALKNTAILVDNEHAIIYNLGTILVFKRRLQKVTDISSSRLHFPLTSRWQTFPGWLAKELLNCIPNGKKGTHNEFFVARRQLR